MKEKEYEQKIQEVCDDQFEFLQDLVKLLNIKKEMPPNLDQWKDIIKQEIENLTKHNKNLNQSDECKFCAGTGYKRGNQCIDLMKKQNKSD